jgi:hypothetical protein
MRVTVATLVGCVLSFLHASHSISGATITLQNPSLAFSIDAACLGTMLLWVYAALVLAEPNASDKQKIRASSSVYAVSESPTKQVFEKVDTL